MQELLSGLNDAQREAVTHGKGPLLVLAGAGSGKTRVLTLRLAFLVRELGVRPWELMAVTFTNKAAGEMKERVERVLGSDAHDAQVATFHSTCLRLLRRDIERIGGYGKDFVVYDDRDSKELMNRVLKDAKLPKTVNPRSISAAVDRAKNEGLSAEALAAQRRPDVDPRVPELYRLYQERLRQSNALDFGDLLLLPIQLLSQHPDVLERYRQRYTWILVDEYQDTNPAQYQLLRLLGDHGDRNLGVVGDEDQSIYSFRGADIRNILEFEKDFPGARTVRLERNYRSSGNILGAASAVVARNRERLGKTLWTERDGGAPIRLHVVQDDREEARLATAIVREEVAAHGSRPRDVAIFFRTNAQSRLLEEEFLASRLPFVLVGGQRFYERKEIKDALAWLKVIVNPQDEVSLFRIVNEPPRGIGEKTLSTVSQRAAERGTGVWDALVDLLHGDVLPARAQAALRAFRELVEDLRRLSHELPLPRLLETVYERTATLERLREEGTFEAEGRLQNLEELAASTLDYASQEPPRGLLSFLDRVALVADSDSVPAEGEDMGRVTLMTVHSAKGLEFPVVLVVGMDEALFPHARAMEFERDLEEERRLCYVAITRARERLYLLRARRRPAAGGRGYEESLPSRFLRDIPRELLAGSVEPERAAARGAAGWRPGAGGMRAPGWGWPGAAAARPATPARRVEREGSTVEYEDGGGAANEGPIPRAAPSLEFQADAERPRRASRGAGTELRPGTRVRHGEFGEGEVRSVDGPAENLRATVFFPRAGVKRLYVRYAGLEIVES